MICIKWLRIAFLEYSFKTFKEAFLGAKSLFFMVL